MFRGQQEKGAVHRFIYTKTSKCQRPLCISIFIIPRYPPLFAPQNDMRPIIRSVEPMTLVTDLSFMTLLGCLFT